MVNVAAHYSNCIACLDEDLGGGRSENGELEFLDDVKGSSGLGEPDGGHCGRESHCKVGLKPKESDMSKLVVAKASLVPMLFNMAPLSPRGPQRRHQLKLCRNRRPVWHLLMGCPGAVRNRADRHVARLPAGEEWVYDPRKSPAVSSDLGYRLNLRHNRWPV